MTAKPAPVVVTKRWKAEDVKDLEGEYLMRAIHNRDKEEEVLETIIKGPGQVARVQIKKGRIFTTYTVVMDVRGFQDMKFLQWVMKCLKRIKV